MAAVTQIVPQFSFPYVDTYITDYTEIEEWYLSHPMTLDEWKQSVEESNSSDSEEVI